MPDHRMPIQDERTDDRPFLHTRPHSPGRELDIVDNVQGYNRFQPYNNIGFTQGTVLIH